jgi:hypothetical protein
MGYHFRKLTEAILGDGADQSRPARQPLEQPAG